jgi:hypothetical protein
MSENLTSQERFNRDYVTGYEIQNILGIQRCSVTTANKRGFLPDPIVIPGSKTFIWEREKVQTYIDAWRIILKARREAKKQ